MSKQMSLYVLCILHNFNVFISKINNIIYDILFSIISKTTL